MFVLLCTDGQSERLCALVCLRYRGDLCVWRLPCLCVRRVPACLSVRRQGYALCLGLAVACGSDVWLRWSGCARAACASVCCLCLCLRLLCAGCRARVKLRVVVRHCVRQRGRRAAVPCRCARVQAGR